MRELNYTDNIERDLGMWPSADESPYLYHFYVYTHMTDISGLDLFHKNDLMKVFSERRRYSYYIPRNLDPENLSKSESTSDIKLSAATVKIRECVISKLRSKFNSQTLSSLNEQLFSDDKCSLPAKDTTVLRTILEDLNQTENVREWFSKPPKPDYPKKLYEFETILYDKENRAHRNYFYIPLIRGTYLYGYLVLIFKEIQKDEINYIVKYLRESVVSKGISFYDRIVKKRYESSHAIKPWLCESISELANCYGMIAIESSEGIPTFRFIECSDSSSTTDVLKKEKLQKIDFDLFGHTFSLKFELGELGDKFCGINRKLERELKALPFKLNTFRRAIKMLKDDSAYRQKACAYALHSAVGSIMSRNGSHNIGSHVLAALSHNVGTLPDDRVLYQYIQQRMDYIATATTDFPTWTQPTMFVADMMKTFLSQRHLLDHIVESEGLHAFQFQNPNMTDEEWAAQKNCVKIHVRRKIGEEYKEFIDYTERDAKVSLQDGSEEYDISLAIPGGIIGEHAFYTILENIIRNAAKHSWATGNNNAKNLDIYIDFTDEDEQVKFKVYAKLETSKCKKLVDELKKRLSQSFIDEDTGALRRENWGLAEMKMSAGYLVGESIEAIGGIGDKKGTNEIIKPYVESSKYLGYEFFIAKPKEILIVVKSIKGWGKNGTRKELEKIGIFVKTVSEIKQEKRLNYRYVVHYNARELFDKNDHVKDDVLLPFRVLSGKEIKDKRLRDFIPTIGISKLKKCFKKNAEVTKNEIKKLVYNTYLEHLLLQRNIKNIGLLVAINENEKVGGNSLISDADILELMLEQNFAVCVDQYKAFAANDDNCKIIKCLESIRHKSSANDKVIKFKYFSDKTIRELVAQRLYDWMNEVENKPCEIIKHLKEKYFAADAKESTKEEEKRPSDKKGSADFDAKVNALLKRHPIDDFIRYVESVFENTKRLFKQYEEQIVTLPAGYKVDNRSSEEDGNDSVLGFKINYKASDVEKDKNTLSWIAYRRHDCTLSVNNESKAEYVEPLSGTQTYLTQLAKVKDDIGLQMRLIENGLMRILVFDERVAKFLREHQKEVGPHYQSMSINVIDHEWVESGNEKRRPDWSYSSFSCKTKEDLRNYVDGGNPELKMFNDVDILIVHQGILDKWFEEFKSDKDKMRKLLEGFKKLVKYVVVTTGRGTPVNIPEEAHLLPFAVVESTLFKKHPEKLILTDTIMNVLPVGMKNGNTGDKK